jgi:leukotriene-A4 hydrolase
MYPRYPTFDTYCSVHFLCSQEAMAAVKEIKQNEAKVKRIDPHSCANFKEIVTRNISLTLWIDFERRVIEGAVNLSLERLTPVQHLLLDVNGLLIKDCLLVPKDGHAFSLVWEIRSSDQMGQELIVYVPEKVDEKLMTIRILYETTEKCQAIHWIQPEQTSGGMRPLMYTQCFPILARSLLPCQDTPAVKAPCSFVLAVPSPLVVLASGNLMAPPEFINEQGKKGNYVKYIYEQSKPIPSYLIAIAAGDFVSEKIGPRSRVYAERKDIAKAKYEFEADTEQFLTTIEGLLRIPYQWGSYNMLVLPHTFSHGVMENPQITFLNMSLCVGDRSLTKIVCHEAIHSWAGNMVTNCRWKDYWLNEGFTVYIERLAIGRIYGKARRDCEILCGYQSLLRTVTTLMKTGNEEWTKLTPDNSCVDPHDSFSQVPYEKGSLFLLFLELFIHRSSKGTFKGAGQLGMLSWITSLYKEYADRSIGVEEVQEHFFNFLRTEAGLKEMEDLLVVKKEWTKWLTAPGMPEFNPNEHKEISRELVSPCEETSKIIRQNFTLDAKANSSEATRQLSVFREKAIPKQIVYLFDLVINEGGLTKTTPKDICDAVMCFTKHTNVEIAFRAIILGLSASYEPAVEAAQQFLGIYGQSGHVKAVLNSLFLMNPKAAKDVYIQNKSRFNFVIHSFADKLFSE